MSASLGKPASMRIDQPAGGALQLEMLATPVDAVARAPGAAKPAHKAKPHSPISSTDGSKVDVEPVVEQMPPPRYPSGAFQQGISGKVVLHVEVGADGRAGGIDVVSAEPKGVFEENTVAAARNWTFKPAMKDGKPVASTLRIPVQFELDAPGE
jgi:TonB family C-terminal domain